jgi:Tol biopolymer transport system component
MKARLTLTALAAAALLNLVPWHADAQNGRPKKILYVSGSPEKFDLHIFTMNPDGSDPAQLTKGEGVELDPVWSPDGKKIAFVVIPKKEEQASDLYVMNADGSGRTRVANFPAKTFATGPAWSPDGKKIAFCTAEMPDGPRGGPATKLLVIDADGKNMKRLGDANGLLPAWSPDGKQILYTLLIKNGDFEPRLHIMNADGTNSRELIKGKAMMGAFSPDGKKIAYMAEGGDQPDIFVMNADGSNPVQLTDTKDIEFAPLWTADGKRIYFTRMGRGGPGLDGQVYAMDPDGKNEARLTKGPGMSFAGGGAALLLMFRSASKEFKEVGKEIGKEIK